MTMADQHRQAAAQASESTADLVQRASEQTSRLVRDEIHLAVAELKAKGRHAGLGAGMLGAAGLVALYGLAGLLVTVVLLLTLAMPAWVAALIVTVVLFAVSGGLALVGRRQVGEVGSPVPQEALEGVKADMKAVTHAVKER